MLTVLTHFQTITIGGVVTGIGIEFSPFNYGQVHITVPTMKVLLTDLGISTTRPS